MSPKVNIVMREATSEPFGPLSNREKIPTAPAHSTSRLRYFDRAKETVIKVCTCQTKRLYFHVSSTNSRFGLNECFIILRAGFTSG